MVTLQMIQEAQESLKGIARKTPLENANRLGENIYIKAENLQLTGAFKIRGAYNKIRSLTPEEASHGVIACSAGNHAQGIALSATKLGIKSVICMPEGAPTAAECFETLLARGIIIRPLKSYSLPDLLRVSIGNQQENLAFLSAMADIIARKGEKA